jgi:beta-lactamase superfamily II metal-dependent hydrolase
MKRSLLGVAIALVIACVLARAAGTLDIYFIDVEGGQATLLVTPAGQSLLIDTGFPSSGTFGSVPGDPAQARDAQRVLAVARKAGVTRINYLLITHFHADHFGGVPELAQLIPIDTFVDHGNVLPVAETNVRGTLAAFDAYAAVRARGRHLEPTPGDRVPLTGVDVTVLSALGSVVARPLPGAGAPNPKCGATAPPSEEVNENPRSTGVVVQFGRFRFLDLGDLAGQPLFDLVCPNDRVGPVDAYLVSHHSGIDASDAATFEAFKPRVVISNNGVAKGGAPETLRSIRSSPGLLDAWQLHVSRRGGADNAPADRIANLDETTAHWIKLSASEDGSFDVENGRTGIVRRYSAR